MKLISPPLSENGSGVSTHSEPMVSQSASKHLRLNGNAGISYFVLFGLFETVVAYFLFKRADDHNSFLEVVNFGTNSQESLSAFSMNLMYVLATPARVLGGHELLHILWFRLIMLFGFISAFEWVRISVLCSKYAEKIDVDRARLWFFFAISIYPGQIAWTASLLRDGIAVAFLFFYLYLWSCGHFIRSLLMMGITLILRPQHAVLIAGLMIAWSWGRCFRRRLKPWLLFWLVCATISYVGFDYRLQVSEFSSVFGDASYPEITSKLDISGYINWFIQALLDPVAVSAPRSATTFQIMDALFFIYIIFFSSFFVRKVNVKLQRIFVAMLFSLWIFAYFEYFVSGFSRHRLAPVISLIACLSIARTGIAAGVKVKTTAAVMGGCSVKAG